MTPEQQKRNEEIDRLTKELYDRDKTIESLRAELAKEKTSRAIASTNCDQALAAMNSALKERDALRAELAEARAQFEKARQWNELTELELTNLRLLIEGQNAQLLSLQSHNAKLGEALRYVLYARLPGGDRVDDHIQPEWLGKAAELLESKLDCELRNTTRKVLAKARLRINEVSWNPDGGEDGTGAWADDPDYIAITELLSFL